MKKVANILINVLRVTVAGVLIVLLLNNVDYVRSFFPEKQHSNPLYQPGTMVYTKDGHDLGMISARYYRKGQWVYKVRFLTGITKKPLLDVEYEEWELFPAKEPTSNDRKERKK